MEPRPSSQENAEYHVVGFAAQLDVSEVAIQGLARVFFSVEAILFVLAQMLSRTNFALKSCDSQRESNEGEGLDFYAGKGEGRYQLSCV